MATTRIFKFTSLILVLTLVVGLTGCEKWVRPNKVKRILSEDSWRVTNLEVNETDMEDLLANVRLGFGDAGSLTILDVQGQKGGWDVGINKKPTTLYIFGLLNEPYFNLNDDWVVLTCSKTKLTAESDNGGVINKLTLTKVETD